MLIIQPELAEARLIRELLEEKSDGQSTMAAICATTGMVQRALSPTTHADRFELVNEPVSGRDGPDMAERTHAVIDAAIQWWLARRPVGWSEAQHLERPAINTTTPREAQLASAVAEFVRRFRAVSRLAWVTRNDG